MLGPFPQYLVPANGHQYRVDFAYPDLKLALEVDGNWHQTSARRSWDKDRDSALSDLGWTTVRFTTRDLEERPRVVVETLRAAGVGAAHDGTVARSQRGGQ